MSDSSYANDGTPIAKVILDDAPTKRTCRANKNQHEDDNYEPCGLNLRALKDGTYKCKEHGIMLV